MTTTLSTAHGPIKAIHIQVPVGIPTPDGGLEIPNRVFLGGIPTETTELELELFFSDFGAVKDVRIVTDRVTGECKGYGFVTFDENEDIAALVRKKTIVMKGKKLRVRKAIRRNGSQFVDSSSPEVSPQPAIPSPVPVSPQHQQHGQFVFIPNQQTPTSPFSPPPQATPQFNFQSCNVAQPNHFPFSPQKPASTCHLPPFPQMNAAQPVYCYPYMNVPPVPVPVSWPLYQQI